MLFDSYKYSSLLYVCMRDPYGPIDDAIKVVFAITVKFYWRAFAVRSLRFDVPSLIRQCFTMNEDKGIYNTLQSNVLYLINKFST